MSIILTMLVCLTIGADPEPALRFTSITIEGKVLSLADALKVKGLTTDPEPIAKAVALVATDGTIYPLLSDDASRALFLDDRLRNRKARLAARRFEGVPYLQVVSIKVEDEGAMRTPEYYCEICTISVRFPQICPCCQGSMVFRMKPERP